MNKVVDANYPLMDRRSQRTRAHIVTKIRARARILLKHYDVSQTILDPFLALKVQELQFKNGMLLLDDEGNVVAKPNELLLDAMYQSQVVAQGTRNANVLGLLVDLTTWIEQHPDLVREYNSTFRRYK